MDWFMRGKQSAMRWKLSAITIYRTNLILEGVQLREKEVFMYNISLKMVWREVTKSEFSIIGEKNNRYLACLSEFFGSSNALWPLIADLYFSVCLFDIFTPPLTPHISPTHIYSLSSASNLLYIHKSQSLWIHPWPQHCFQSLILTPALPSLSCDPLAPYPDPGTFLAYCAKERTYMCVRLIQFHQIT